MLFRSVVGSVSRLDEVVSAKGAVTAGSTVTYDCSTATTFIHTSTAGNWTANFTNLGLAINKLTKIKVIVPQGNTAYYPNVVKIAGTTITPLYNSQNSGGGSGYGHKNGTDFFEYNIYNNNAGVYTVYVDVLGGYV